MRRIPIELGAFMSFVVALAKYEGYSSISKVEFQVAWVGGGWGVGREYIVKYSFNQDFTK